MKKRANSYRPVKNKKMLDSFTVEKDDTLLASLIAFLPQKKRNTIKAVLKDKQVSVDDIPVTQFDHVLTPGQKVTISWDRSAPQTKSHGLKIIFEDQYLIIIDKPAGLLTISTDKEKRQTAYAFLNDYVKAEDPDNKIFVLHRLDRETSGLLMFTKTKAIKQQIQETWNTAINQQTYFAVVEGKVEKPEETITSWLTESKALKVYSSQNQQVGHQKAITHFKKIRGNDEFTLLQINMETSVKHQMRVHLQDIKHPIIGDKKYGSGINPIRRMALHAQFLAFTHPKTGKLHNIEIPIPKIFLKLVTNKKK